MKERSEEKSCFSFENLDVEKQRLAPARQGGMPKIKSKKRNSARAAANLAGGRALTWNL